MDSDGKTSNDGGIAPVLAARPRRKAGRPRLDSIVARHNDILAIALDLFIEHGYANVTLAMLAASAHMAVRTIYIKFGSKDGLLSAMITAEHERHRAQLALLELDKLAMDQRLQAIVLAEGDDALTRRFHEAGPGQAIPPLRAIMEAGQRQRQMREELDPALLCELFFSCVGGNRATLWQRGAPQESHWLLGLNLFLDAVRPARPL